MIRLTPPSPPETGRYTAKLKLRILACLRSGDLTVKLALKLYGLSVEELNEWIDGLSHEGPEGLRATKRAA